MSKVKSALMCEACNGTGEVFSPRYGLTVCPYCHGRGYQLPRNGGSHV